MGAVADAMERSARHFGADIRVDARVAQDRGAQRPGDRRRAGGRRADRRPHRGHHAPPEDGVPGPDRGARAARRLRHRHQAVEDPQRRGQDQPGPRRAAQLHRRPVRRDGRAPHRLGRDGTVHRVHGGGLPRRPGRPSGDPAVQRRRHPHDVGQDTGPRRHAHHVDVLAVGARVVVRGAPSPRSSRPTPTGWSTATTRWRPNFKKSIIHRDVVGPYEMEQEYGLIGGNIFHGELSLEQLFTMRPAPGYADYRTPIKGLYNGSSATHAGGGVSAASRVGRPCGPPSPTRSRRRAWRASCALEVAAMVDPAVRAMMEARRIAVVGRQCQARSFGHRVVSEVTAEPVGSRGPPRQPPLRRGARAGRASTRSMTSTARSTWCSWASAIGPSRSRCGRAAARGDRSAVVYGSLFEPDDPTSTAIRDRVAAIGTRRRHGPLRRRLHGLRQRRPRRPGDRLHRA